MLKTAMYKTARLCWPLSSLRGATGAGLQAALLLSYCVSTYYVSRQLLPAAIRTELPEVFEAIPFTFDTLVFMLPKGPVALSNRRRLSVPDLSRTTKAQVLLLPIRELDFDITAELRTWLTVIDKCRCTTLVVGL